MSANIAATRIS